MKTHSLASWTWLLATAILPALTVSAQTRRPIYTDAEHAARAQQETQAQMMAQQQEQARQAKIMNDLQCLQNTTNVLQQSFAEHCSRRKLVPNSPEIELSRTLTDLQGDVKHLADDILGRCGKTGRVDLEHVYRTFHLVEYAAENSQAVAARAGYSRSLSGYFNDIGEHIEELGQAGFRNPRLKSIEMEGHYHQGGKYASAQERQVALPPVPVAPAPPPVPAADPRRQGTTIDLGDVLGRLFGKKPR